jgi:multidrug resistance efflux pump
MRISGAKQAAGKNLPLTRESLDEFIAAAQRKATFFVRLQSAILLMSATLVFIISAITLIWAFYNAPVSFAKRSWIQVRNLTPVIAVNTRVNGVLEQVFVSHGQLVQKGELLAAVQTTSIKLDYEQTQRDFADKIVELHCLGLLLSNKSVFKLPYDAQILVDQMVGQADVSYRAKQCERELLRNVVADQLLEETIAALEDQSRLLKTVVKIRGQIKTMSSLGPKLELGLAEDTEFAWGGDQEALRRAYHDQYFPMMRLAEVEQKLKSSRREYFSRKVQKEEDLTAAIEQTTQEMRYLDKRLRELDKQLKNNFIYASTTGTIVGSKVSKVGAFLNENETVFELQPIENQFQVAVSIEEEDSDRFKTGTLATVSLEKNLEKTGQLKATTVAVLRKPSGKLEAVLDLDGNAKENAEIILASGYRGEGEQRLPANIIVGQSKTWRSSGNIIFGTAVDGSI